MNKREILQLAIGRVLELEEKWGATINTAYVSHVQWLEMQVYADGWEQGKKAIYRTEIYVGRRDSEQKIMEAFELIEAKLCEWDTFGREEALEKEVNLLRERIATLQHGG